MGNRSSVIAENKRLIESQWSKFVVDTMPRGSKLHSGGNMSEQNRSELEELSKEEGKDIKFDSRDMKHSYNKKQEHMGVDGHPHEWGFHPSKHGEAAREKKEARQQAHVEAEHRHAQTTDVPKAFQDAAHK